LRWAVAMSAVCQRQLSIYHSCHAPKTAGTTAKPNTLKIIHKYIMSTHVITIPIHARKSRKSQVVA
jgi:hypothetical protein